MQHPLTWLFERPYPTEPKYVKRLKEELQIIKAKNFEETYETSSYNHTDYKKKQFTLVTSW